MTGRLAAEIYEERSQAFAKERDRLDSRLKNISHGRAAAFLTFVICLLAALDLTGMLRALMVGFGIVLLATFFVLVFLHSKTRARHRLTNELWCVNRDALLRLGRSWGDLPVLEYTAPPNHPYAADLDLFGRGSLFQLLGTATTIPGRKTLRDWLLEPAKRETVLERQGAVRELAAMLDYRDHLEANGRMVGKEHPRALKAFVGWAEDDDWILNKPWLIWAARILPLVTLPSLALHITGQFTIPVWALSIGISAVITMRSYATMHSIFGLVASGDLGLRRYGDVFESASNSTFDSAMLKDLSSRMAPAAEEMRRLDQLITMAEVRYSGMLYGIVQLLLLWDQNVMVSLEKWRRSSGANVDGWISALGELEAIAALAGMSHAHPDWVFPEIYEHEEAPIMDAKEVGHPLIPPEKCIVNDIRLGPPGTFLFVTGSNMSGKSTLLRSIGVNTTLALAGGPVFASKMRLPTASLLTSMRVTDSLEQGISQYMAQLERLKMVVDGCEAGRNNESGPRALFLLDEILQGTNSSERLVAVRRIVQRLIETGAIGAVTSHELTVPEVPILSEAAQIVHFRETATRDSDGVSLSFDYKLRQGLSTTTNALKLMELIGLD